MMIKIVVADDHLLIREGFKRLLKPHDDIVVCAEAGNGHDALQMAREHRPDVIVLDMSMPGPTGVELIGLLHRQVPGSAILVVSMHPEDRFAVRALRAGALGYLNKTVASDELLVAIRRVAQGRRYVGPAVAEALAEQLAGSSDESTPHSLSARERQVHDLLVEGLTVTEIAERLHLSVKTISTHKAHLMQKLHVSSLADLVRQSIRHDPA